MMEQILIDRVDQEDNWVIKFKLGLNLFDLSRCEPHKGVMEKRE